MNQYFKMQAPNPAQAISGVLNSGIVESEPKNPPLLAHAEEILKFVSEAEHVVDGLFLRLFGESQSQANMSGADRIACLESTIAMSCTRIACLVGALRTIESRLGEYGPGSLDQANQAMPR